MRRGRLRRLGTLGRAVVPACLLVLVLGITGAQSAPLAAYVVTTTADSGVGSLRQAILDANANAGADTITFGIAGDGVHKIQPTSNFPNLTEAVTIDGTTESDYVVGNPPRIELDGTSAPSFPAFMITAPDVTIRGLTINRYTGSTAIQITATASNTKIEASYIGLDATGTTAAGNANGIHVVSSGNTIGGSTADKRNVIAGNPGSAIVLGGGSNTVQGNYVGTTADGLSALGNLEGVGVLGNGNTIGGPNPGEGNVLSGSLTTSGAGAGVSFSSSAGSNTVEGNLIGTDKNGTAAIPNSRRGIYFGSDNGASNVVRGNVISGNGGDGITLAGNSVTIQGNLIGTNRLGTAALANAGFGIQVTSGSSANVIGGTTATAGNVISGNNGSGIVLGNSGNNQVFGNTIGTTAGGAPLPNASHGVEVLFATGNVIGGEGSGEPNRIRSNSGDGVQVYAGTGHKVSANEIADNGGQGIDLNGEGVTPNDAGDGDTGANNLQNFPVLTSATGGASTSVGGSLDTAAGTYRVEFFANTACDGTHGEGARFLGGRSLPPGPFSATGLGASSAGEVVTATATDSSGNTSEFSACQAVSGGGGGPQPGPTYTVNTDADGTPADAGCNALPGDCTLREAIAASNASAAVDNSIIFDFDGSDITLDSPLPDIVDKVVLDGSNAQQDGEPVIVDGSATTDSGFVLQTGSDTSRIQDFRMRGFNSVGAAAIEVLSATNVIYSNAISSVATGVVLSGGGATGNRIGNGDGRGNEIWGFTSAGVLVDTAGTANLVQSNVIGLDSEGAPDAGTNGIVVRTTAGTVVGDNVPPDGLGGLNTDLGNVVVGADAEGIVIDGETTSGTVVTANLVGTDSGGANLGNGIGIDVESFAFNNQLGPGNTVAFNGDAGIQISNGDGNRIVANSIHSNGGLGINLFNGGNDELPAPNLTSVTSGSIAGTFVGTEGRDYYLEIFMNDSCTGAEGKTYVGFITVSDGSFDQDLYPLSLTDGDSVTTTLTDSVTNDTTEFSNCVEVGGGGGGGDPPVLFGAVPNAVGSTLGVAGAWYSGTPVAGTTFGVAFYSVPDCDPIAPKTPLGSRSGLVTNDAGIGAFAIDGLTNVPVGTLVTATVDGSPISNCVVADLSNTSWPTALELGPNDDVTGHLRASGEGRWFKVPVLPNSRVSVSLSGLPADYDLVVFSDVQAAYDRLVGGEDYVPEQGPNLALDDLTRAGADTPTDVFNTSQFNPSAMEPTNWDPELNSAVFSPTQFSPTQFSESLWSATYFSPTQFSPTQFSPTQFSPTQFSPTQFSPTQFSPTQFSPTQFSPAEWAQFNPADPRAFTAAQTASIVAVSSNPGTSDEGVSVNTWNNTGFFYMRVQGKNGSFDPDQSFSLDVSRDGNLCSGVVDQPSAPTASASGRKTVILYDSTRLPPGGSLLAKLNTFAGRPEVAGALVDVSSSGAVNTLNGRADANPSCPYAKNLVASAIKRIIDAYRASNPIQYVVVVGGDRAIPFYRYPDPALLGNETMYVPPVADNTASQASLRLGYVLSDDFLASSETVSLHGNAFPIPDLAIGRLVETPAEIEGMLDAYLGTANGVVSTPTRSLTTGYDFLTDAADEIADHFDQGIGAGNTDELITDNTISPGVVSNGANNADSYYRTRSWTATDLRRELLGTSHDLIFLAGHFSANDALSADYRTNVLATELPTSSVDLVNAIVFSAGCHTGYNIVNQDATQWTEPLDWAQAFARKRATLISATGYQYGDTDFIAHSERIYTELARQLRLMTQPGGEPIAVGGALLRSKQKFLEDTPGLSSLDEKALLVSTLFGLPMLSVDLPSGRISDAPETSVVPAVTGVGAGPGAELGLKSANLSVGATLGSNQKQMTDGPLTTWLSGPDGVAVKPTQPILPLESLNVTPPSGESVVLRGVGFRSGSYTDTTGTTPLTAAPATELRGIHAPFLTDVFFPQQPWTPNYFGALGGSGATQLHVTPAQHRSESPTMTRRQFSNLGLQLFYSGNVTSYCGSRDAPAPCASGFAAATPALAAPPAITGVSTSYAGGVLTFEAHVVGDPIAGIQNVWVTWTIPPGSGVGAWQSVDLEQDEDDATLWRGTLTTANPGAVNFVVQAVNGVGRVTIDDNLGAFYRPGFIPGPPDPDASPPTATTTAFVGSVPSPLQYRQSFSVTVRLTAGGSPLSGKIVRVSFGGGGGLPAQTNGSGEVTVPLSAALSPGSYRVTASFAGDATHAPSDASAGVQVVRRPTTLTLSGTLLAANPLTATLTAQGATPTPLHQRNVFLVITGGPLTQVYSAKTDPEGRVQLPQSLLATLPPQVYTVDAYFNGATLPGPVVVTPDDVDYGPSNAHLTIDSWLGSAFSGFVGMKDPPMLNSAKAGTAVPVKFNLGANRGLSIFATGYPKVGTVPCNSPNATPGGLVTAVSNGLKIDTKNNQYTWDWKTASSWKNSCRALIVRFADGTEKKLLFRF